MALVCQMKVELKVGEEKANTPFSIGIQQGDNTLLISDADF